MNLEKKKKLELIFGTTWFWGDFLNKRIYLVSVQRTTETNIMEFLSYIAMKF